jgi:hypothetical protein
MVLLFFSVVVCFLFKVFLDTDFYIRTGPHTVFVPCMVPYRGDRFFLLGGVENVKQNVAA